MTWVSLLDDFHSNPKVIAAGFDGAGLYARALSYCGDYLTDGFIPEEWLHGVVGRKRNLILKCLEVGLLRRVNSGYEIPQYLDYNPPKAYVLQLREKRSQSGQKGANKRWGDSKSHSTGDGKSDSNRDSKTDGKTIARARATTPSHTPLGPDQKVRDNSTAAGTTAEQPAAELEQKLKTLGWWPGQIEAAHQKPELAWAWINYAERNADTNPGALSREGFESGQPPSASNNGTRPADVYTACLNYLASPEAQDELSTRNVILEEFTIRERKIGKTLTPEQRSELLAIWETK